MISLEFKDDRQAKNKTGIIIILRAGLLFSEIEVVMTRTFCKFHVVSSIFASENGLSCNNNVITN